MKSEQLKLEQKAFEAWVETSQILATHQPENLLNSLWRAWYARAQQSTWISVNDRLPQLKEDVLVAWSNGEIGFARRFNPQNSGERWDTTASNATITHWQPMPALPKADAFSNIPT